jgi:hypothetical protein
MQKDIKKIPVYMGGKFMRYIDKRRPIITNCYNEVGKVWKVKKIYYTAGVDSHTEKIIMER